ncbi:DUF6719 family protein [Methylobacterium crusticola]|uniref:DUF6719 family protein n=1 Tax=Methylobacterium crusticola TaxID=1697972 RepID=UPI0034D75799
MIEVTVRIVFLIYLLCITSTAYAQRILHTEPPQGGIRNGESVLVDNGKCPRGQILKVTGNYLDADQSTYRRLSKERDGIRSENTKQKRRTECVPLYPTRLQTKRPQQ